VLFVCAFCLDCGMLLCCVRWLAFNQFFILKGGWFVTFGSCVSYVSVGRALGLGLF